MPLPTLSSKVIREEKIKAFQVFAVISNFVNVDEKFYFYLLNFLHNAYAFVTDSVTVKNYAGFALVNFVKNRNLDDRQVRGVESDVKLLIVG